MSAYDNNGIISHLTLNGCTVINHGTIAHLDGTNNHIDNYGNIAHNEGGRVIVAGSYQRMEPQVKVVYKDRIVYRDRVVYRDRPAGKPTGTVAIKEEELRTLRGQAKYWLQKSEELEGENTRLKKELEDTERQKLLREIEDLKDKLKKARQRENVAVQQRKDAEKQARQTIANVWDQYRPTKEACKQLYENLKAFLDCETE